MPLELKAALLVVDVQRYYLEPNSSFYNYSELCWPGCMSYISKRTQSTVIPAIKRLKSAFLDLNWPTIFLRLCSEKEDRSDMHRFFRSFWLKAKSNNFFDTYPMADDPWADICSALTPEKKDIIINKGSFSGFYNTKLYSVLKDEGVNTVVMTGLATSQCVESSARVASEHGFIVVHVEDGQADYDLDSHEASLYASRGICGGHVVDSEYLAASPKKLLRAFAEIES